MAVKQIKLDKIKASNEVQPRVSLDHTVLSEYTDRLKAGDKFPAVVAFDDGETIWLSDGFHRFKAHKDLKRAAINADIRKGTKRDAIWFAITANAHNSIRLKRADKRRAVERILDDPEWAKYSNNKIATSVGCSEFLVRSIITEREEKGEEREKEKVVTRAGKEQKQDTSNIGSKSKKKEEEEEPKTSWTAEDDDDPEEEEEKAPSKPPEPPQGAPVDDRVDVADMPYHARSRALRGLTVLIEGLLEVKGKGYFESNVEASVDFLAHEIAPAYKASKKGMDQAILQDATKTAKQARVWMAGENKPKEPKEKEKNPEGLPQWAFKLVDQWENSIGMPPTYSEKEKPKYAKALHDIVRIDGQEKEVVEEVIVGAKICWVDEGIPILSPLGLREKVKSKACKKWESIWDSYRKHPEYKPLRPVPKCPECGKKLRLGQIQQRGRDYSIYLCPAHPNQSRKVGIQFMPQRLIK